jgi:ankyrin repeat protein
MKLNKITALMLPTLLSLNIMAAEIEPTNTVNSVPNAESTKKSAVILGNETIVNILKHETLAKRYILLKSYISNSKNLLITIIKDGKSYNIPVLSYLLMEGYEEESLKLVKEKLLTPYESFPFNDNEYNDVLISILNEQTDYFNYVVHKFPEKLNEQFKFNNEEGYYLLMAVAENKTLQSGISTTTLLDLGASPYIQTLNGHTAEKLAAAKNNNYFLESLHHFENKTKSKNSRLNPPLPYKERIQEEKIIENLNNGLLTELEKSYSILNEQWITLIIHGYNKAADMLYSSLSKMEEFDINTPNKNGINALMATTMSKVPSGNIEYAIKLFERDIDPNYEFKNTTSMDIAIKKDAYKIVILLIKNKVNFVKNKEGIYYFDIALKNKSLRSAYILKETAKEMEKIYQEQKK